MISSKKIYSICVVGALKLSILFFVWFSVCVFFISADFFFVYLFLFALSLSQCNWSFIENLSRRNASFLCRFYFHCMYTIFTLKFIIFSGNLFSHFFRYFSDVLFLFGGLDKDSTEGEKMLIFPFKIQIFSRLNGQKSRRHIPNTYNKFEDISQFVTNTTKKDNSI